MRAELQNKLAADFPSFFRDLGGDPRYTCMAFGCDIGSGWYGLLRRACQEIQEEIAEHPELKGFKFTQIKEKFGTLRLYACGGNGEIYTILAHTELASQYVCEDCGTTLHGVSTEGRWLQTLCVPCRASQPDPEYHV